MMAAVAALAMGAGTLSSCTADAPERPPSAWAADATGTLASVVPTKTGLLDRQAQVPASSWYLRDEKRRLLVDLPMLDHVPAPSSIVDLYRPYAQHFLDEAKRQPIPRPAAAAPALTVGWHGIAASSSIIGIAVTLDEFAGANGTTATRVHWVDRSNGRLLDWRDLFAPEARPQVIKQVGSALRRAGADAQLVTSVLNEKPQPATSDRVGGTSVSVAFAQNGDLDVVLPQGSVGAESLGAQTVRIRSGVLNGALSRLGREAQSASSTARSGVASGSTATVPNDQPKVNCRETRCIALTFDDGPGPDTPRLLDTLRQEKVPATFFMLGQQVTEHPAIVRRVVAEGFGVGDHSWSHPQLTGLTSAQVRSQMSDTAAVIQRVSGVRPKLARPPYGAHNARVDEVLASLGMPIVLWNVDSEDWKSRNAHAVQQVIAREAKPGAIVLMHDIHPTTVDAVPGVIAELRNAGYTLVDLDDIMATRTPGRVVTMLQP